MSVLKLQRFNVIFFLFFFSFSIRETPRGSDGLSFFVLYHSCVLHSRASRSKNSTVAKIVAFVKILSVHLAFRSKRLHNYPTLLTMGMINRVGHNIVIVASTAIPKSLRVEASLRYNNNMCYMLYSDIILK